MTVKAKIDGVPVIGDTDFRGSCPLEGAEQKTLVNWFRKCYPSLACLLMHVKNEGKRTNRQLAADKANGMTSGTSDIIILTTPAIAIELKRKDRTQSTITDDQVEFLRTARALGAHACVALGWESAAGFIKGVLDG